MKSPAIPLHPTWDVNHRFVLPVSHLVAIWVIRLTVCVILGLVFKSPLFYLIMAPKHKSTDAGNSDILLLCLIYKLNFSIGMYA